MAGKPVFITRVVDSMTSTPRPTRAEATDVANAILDGLPLLSLPGCLPLKTADSLLAMNLLSFPFITNKVHVKEGGRARARERREREYNTI